MVSLFLPLTIRGEHNRNQAMSDLSQDSLLREIDEDIRRERYARLWKRFGNYIIAAVVALLLGIAGYQFWQYRVDSQRQQASAQLASASTLTGTDRAAAEQTLAGLAAEGPAGIAVLAGLRHAALLAESGDVQAARAAYQQVQRSASDPLYRDLAVVREAMVALAQEDAPIDAEAIIDKLKPLTSDGNPWRFSARELTALLASRSGQIAEARSLLGELSADPLAPAGVRERARQLLGDLARS
jgi:hypothetical protein